MDLKLLTTAIDYEKHYSYDKRTDLFNKYKITTAYKNFVPIWELAQFILKTTGQNNNSFVYRYGHFQNALENSYDHHVEDKFERRIVVTESGKSIIIKRYVKDAKEILNRLKYRNAIRFDLEKKTISLYKELLEDGVFQISRDLYDKIDEWLIDHEFEKW